MILGKEGGSKRPFLDVLGLVACYLNISIIFEIFLKALLILKTSSVFFSFYLCDISQVKFSNNVSSIIFFIYAINIARSYEISNNIANERYQA